MSFWSSVSFNFAILINLLVAFFYPFGSNTGGMSVFFNQSIYKTEFSVSYNINVY